MPDLKFLKDPILRICMLVMGAGILVMGAISALTYYKACDRVLDGSIRMARLNVEKAKAVVERHLTAIETTAANLASTRIKEYRDEEQIYSLLERFVASNPEIWGIAVGYEPQVIPGREEGFAPFARRNGGSIERINLPDEGRDYLKSGWYTTSLREGKPHWTKPFQDVRNALVVSYCLPLTDREGRTIGVIALDMQLDRFTEALVQEIHPYEHAECMVLDKDFDFIAHPNHSLIMTSLSDLVEEKTETDGYEANESILIKMQLKMEGHDTYAENTPYEGVMFYAPITQTDWTVALSVLKSDIFAESRDMARHLFFLCLPGVLLMVCASGFLFAKMRKVVEHKAGIERELSMAHNIQMAMVKKVFPAYPDRDDIDVFATLIPAKDVGGDLYDFALRGDMLHFCIGDVSGKGVPASLFMAITRTLYRSIIAREESPARIAEALNSSIAVDNKENMFVTMYIGVLDLKEGVLTLCNCGHNAPLVNAVVERQAADSGMRPRLRPTARMEYLSSLPTNIPIGVIEEFEYEEVTLKVEPGCTFFLYTDGVTEAENAAHVLYGDERLKHELDGMNPRQRSAQLDVEHILNSVHAHADGAIQSDDITMLSFHYKQPSHHET